MQLNLSEKQIFYFLGIGGIGMSALARYFLSKGATVIGYDRTSTTLTTEMQLAGIAIHFDDSVQEIPSLVHHASKESVLVVYTPAVPGDCAELNWFQSRGYTCIKRSVLLGAVTAHSRCAAIAGTHGKTTTSSILAHLLTHSGVGCNAFLGGIATNYGSNLLLSADSDLTVVEADEFDRSFLALSPLLAVITSMDADHLDIYGDAGSVEDSFHQFTRRVQRNGLLLLRHGLEVDASFRKDRPDVKILTYSIASPDASYVATSIRVNDGRYTFNFRGPEVQLDNLELGLPGRHNVENAVAACALALLCGVAPDQIKSGLSEFLGVRRRFEKVIVSRGITYLDDYAHHPEELKASIRSAREMYPGQVLTGVFQPHLFTRTRDFADAFAEALGELDRVILLPIYPARELPIPGVDSHLLLDKIPHLSKKVVEKDELLNELRQVDSGVILTLGAGDIDTLVSPIRDMLKMASDAG